VARLHSAPRERVRDMAIEQFGGPYRSWSVIAIAKVRLKTYTHDFGVPAHDSRELSIGSLLTL